MSEPHALLAHALSAHPKSGPAIEAESFAIIDSLVPNHPEGPTWEVVRRMIHACADTAIVSDVEFSEGAVAAGVAALRGCAPIYTDANMIRAGLSLARLRSVCPDYSPDHLKCFVADREVAAQAATEGLPRALYAVRKAAPDLAGGIALFGNSPVGLAELNRLIVEEGLRPALVVGMPVGFVHVVEAKDELLALPVPHIVLRGRRGGSALAVSCLHALCTLAEAELAGALPDALVILGHGSRSPGASAAMEQVADALRARPDYPRVAVAHMENCEPCLAATLDACAAAGARRILVMPYFLHCGTHMKEDIPQLLRDWCEPHPQVEVFMGNALGFDELLVSLVDKRMREALGGPAAPVVGGAGD